MTSFQRHSIVPPNLFQHVLQENDVSSYLVLHKDDQAVKKIEAGLSEALIVYTTQLSDESEEFKKIFTTTYRTFITPFDLVDKLIYRYSYFVVGTSDESREIARGTFKLLERIFYDLTTEDFTAKLVEKLDTFLKETICSTYGDTVAKAKAMHNVVVETTKNFRRSLSFHRISFHSRQSIGQTLLNFNADEIAQQMTLVDSENVTKIKPFELLLWATEHSREKSPNLSAYMEHFNKLILWVQSQILKSENEKLRELNMLNFLNILKELRKINNYNSYYAIVTAVDSQRVRRLDWNEAIKKQLDECSLSLHAPDSNSKSNFQTYRALLENMSGPCIPYLGMFLQDLSMANISKPNWFADNLINFAKRTEMYNILEKFIQLKDSEYTFEKDEDITGFFGNFENYLDEQTLWMVSEKIKPRSGSLRHNSIY